MSSNISFGRRGEDIAADFLKKNNYKVLKKNYRTKLGEIDIVAENRGTICFIEVKSRHSEKFGSPQEAVFRHKQRQISKAALCYLKENRLLDRRARFDVLSITYEDNNPRIGLIKNAFELAGGYTY